MLKISFISTNYIILFELKEYLCIILVFSSSSFIFATKKIVVFFFQQRWKLVRGSYKSRHFENKIIGGKWSRDRYLH